MSGTRSLVRYCLDLNFLALVMQAQRDIAIGMPKKEGGREGGRQGGRKGGREGGREEGSYRR